ncbi:hypothetical protein [Clostridium kluyveri]|uniref:hypothetical protein n=1 Tax=Clostridium kluyveri TaxID=1534 RepID=UPI0012EC0C07|nr:hypothetical protein [Clostridium kluyveri]
MGLNKNKEKYIENKKIVKEMAIKIVNLFAENDCTINQAKSAIKAAENLLDYSKVNLQG